MLLLQIMEFLHQYWDLYVIAVTGDEVIDDDKFTTAFDEVKEYIHNLKNVRFPDPSIVGQWDEKSGIDDLLDSLRSVVTIHDLQGFEFQSPNDVKALEEYFSLTQSDPDFYCKIFRSIHKSMLDSASTRIAALGKFPLALHFGHDHGNGRAKIIVFHLESEGFSLMLTPTFVFQYNGVVYSCKDLKHAMILVYGQLFPDKSVSIVIHDSLFELSLILDLRLPLPDILHANERTRNIPTLFVSSPSIRIEQTCAGRSALDIPDRLYYTCSYPQLGSGCCSSSTPIPNPCLVPGFMMVRTSVPGTFSFEQLDGSKVTQMITFDKFENFVLSYQEVDATHLIDLEDRFDDAYNAIGSNNMWTQRSPPDPIFCGCPGKCTFIRCKETVCSHTRG